MVDDHAEFGVAPLGSVMSSLNIVQSDDPDDSLSVRMSSISGLPRIKVSTVISGHPRSGVGKWPDVAGAKPRVNKAEDGQGGSR